MWWNGTRRGWHAVFSCRGSIWGIASQPRAGTSMSRDLCLGPAPWLGLPKLKGTTAEQSTSKETLLYFFLHITFFSAINKQKILFCAQKSKDFFPAVFTWWALKLTFLTFHYHCPQPCCSLTIAEWEHLREGASGAQPRVWPGLTQGSATCLARANSGLLGITGCSLFLSTGCKGDLEERQTCFSA